MKPLSDTLATGYCSTGWSTRAACKVATAKPAAIAAKPSAIAKPNALRRARNATTLPANAALAAAHQAGSRSAVK